MDRNSSKAFYRFRQPDTPRPTSPYSGDGALLGENKVLLARDLHGVPDLHGESLGFSRKRYRQKDSGSGSNWYCSSDSEAGSELESTYSSDQEADETAWSDSSDDADFFSLVDEKASQSEWPMEEEKL